MGGKNASRKSQARKNSFDGACLQFPTPCQNQLKLLIFNDKKMLVMMWAEAAHGQSNKDKYCPMFDDESYDEE